mgnify:CR=1 FL=1
MGTGAKPVCKPAAAAVFRAVFGESVYAAAVSRAGRTGEHLYTARAGGYLPPMGRAALNGANAAAACAIRAADAANIRAACGHTDGRNYKP